MNFGIFILTVFVLITTCHSYEISEIKTGRIESCRGCSLNRLPEVKQFVLQDVPLYDRMETIFISGAPPELVLLDKDDKPLQRIPLSELNRKQCNDLLKEKGFTKLEKSEF